LITTSNEVQHRAALMGVTLRRSRPDDADDFAALMNDDSVHPQLMQLPYTDAAFWRERLKPPGGPDSMDVSLVVEHDGHVVASAGMHAAGARVRQRHVMMIGLSVSKAWQGRGAGDLLMTALCHHADAWLGILRLELSVFVDNTRAVALYQKHGFVVEGVLQAFVMRQGALVDAYTMARIAPQASAWPRVKAANMDGDAGLKLAHAPDVADPLRLSNRTEPTD
jgi:L-phenylalanine/L-methionine N-acetyltransferase